MDAVMLAGYHFDIHHVSGTTYNTRQARLAILVSNVGERPQGI